MGREEQKKARRPDLNRASLCNIKDNIEVKQHSDQKELRKRKDANFKPTSLAAHAARKRAR